MSDALGAVRFPTGVVMFFRYHGISDICGQLLFESPTDAWLRTSENRLGCRCMDGRIVEAFSSYGSGMYWTAAACQRCRAIVAEFDPFESRDRKGGVPAWALDFFDERARVRPGVIQSAGDLPSVKP